MSLFRPIDRKTAYLLPPLLEDGLPKDHLARFMVEGIDELDIEESRILPVSGGGFEQACNAQAGVDAESLRVVTAEVTQAPDDKEQVVPLLDQLAPLPESQGRVVQLLADTGYCSEKNVEACEAAGRRSRARNGLASRVSGQKNGEAGHHMAFHGENQWSTAQLLIGVVS
jgi:hypothetical protein